MSIAAINWALNEVTNITATQKAILLALADRADAEGCCFPSWDDIARRSCASRNTVWSALRKFEEMGLLVKTRRYSQSTVYRLKIGTIDSPKIDTINSRNIGTKDSRNIETLTTNESPNNHQGEFDEFWKRYPRKVGKAKAITAFNKLSKTDRAAMMEVLPKYPWSDEERYIPHASSWLNQRRWEDQVTTKTKKRRLTI